MHTIEPSTSGPLKTANLSAVLFKSTMALYLLREDSAKYLLKNKVRPCICRTAFQCRDCWLLGSNKYAIISSVSNVAWNFVDRSFQMQVFMKWCKYIHWQRRLAILHPTKSLYFPVGSLLWKLSTPCFLPSSLYPYLRSTNYSSLFYMVLEQVGSIINFALSSDILNNETKNSRSDGL